MCITKKIVSWALSLLLIVICTARPAGAHPHVFVDNSLELVFDAAGLTGVKVRWVFDALSSSQYLMDLDTNGDGTLTREEWIAQRNDISGFLAEEGYYLHVAANGRKIAIPSVTDFMATVEDGMLVYSFFAPLRVPRGVSMQLAVYDPSYYTDFLTEESEIRFDKAPAGLQHALADAPELAFYSGQIIPLALRLQF